MAATRPGQFVVTGSATLWRKCQQHSLVERHHFVVVMLHIARVYMYDLCVQRLLHTFERLAFFIANIAPLAV